ncbi:hypothetical protein EV177_010093, partial [Coemansia sp. RSA 1804]
TQGGQVPEDGAPRVHIHGAGGAGRNLRRHLPSRDIRCDHGACVYSHVPSVAPDQINGCQDGSVGRRIRRGVWRIPVLPLRAVSGGVPQGDRQPRAQPAYQRLSARQQVDDGLGTRGPCAIPRQGVPAGGNERAARGQAVLQGYNGEGHHPSCLRYQLPRGRLHAGGDCRGPLSARGCAVAPEGAVQRWCRVLVDRLAEGVCCRQGVRRGHGCRKGA